MKVKYGVDWFAARNEERTVKTKRKREQEIIEKKKKDIARLSTRAHLWKGKKQQKLEEEQAYTLPLECWGFSRK